MMDHALLAHIAVSASMTADGDLKPVGYLKEKLDAAARDTTIEVVVVAAGQKDVSSCPPGLRLIKAATIQDAMERLRREVFPGLYLRSFELWRKNPERFNESLLDSSAALQDRWAAAREITLATDWNTARLKALLEPPSFKSKDLQFHHSELHQIDKALAELKNLLGQIKEYWNKENFEPLLASADELEKKEAELRLKPGYTALQISPYMWLTYFIKDSEPPQPAAGKKADPLMPVVSLEILRERVRLRQNNLTAWQKWVQEKDACVEKINRLLAQNEKGQARQKNLEECRKGYDEWKKLLKNAPKTTESTRAEQIKAAADLERQERIIKSGAAVVKAQLEFLASHPAAQ